MRKRSWLNREVFGWAMFDFANQAFTLVILTAMYQVYFVNQVVADDQRLGRQLWATSGIVALIVVIATSPIIGALADFSGAKKKLLFITYLGCVAFTSSLGLVQPGWVAAGMILFIAGYIFYATGENFLGSFLPELARHRDMGKVSAFGWTLGYVGGLLCLGGAAAITAFFPVSASVLLNDGRGTFEERVELAIEDNGAAGGVVTRNVHQLLEAHEAPSAGDATEGRADLPPALRERIEEAGGIEHVVIADLDGDGDHDLAIPDRVNDRVLVFLDPEGDGEPYRVDEKPIAIAAADVDGDGHGDLLVACVGSNTIHVLHNTGRGAFRDSESFPAGEGLRQVYAADLDGDGDEDILVRRSATSATGYRVVMLWCGVFFGLAGLVTFLLLRERKQAEAMPERHSIWTVGFARLAETFRAISGYKHLFRFIAIMTFYLAGMQIVIWFAGTITKELFNFSDMKMALFLLQITVTAIIGAFITGRVQDRIGTRNTIHIALLMWAFVMIGAAFVRSEPIFWILSNGVGLGMGALGTASRSMVGLFSPPHKAAEFFGFYGLGTKLAIVLGLGLTIIAEELFPQSYHLVVASSAIFFLGGIALLFMVDEKAGRIAALRRGREHIRQFHDFKRPAEELE